MVSTTTTQTDSERRYHHGDLRGTLLRAAAAEIERAGVGALSLRALARAAGVSHAAPTHHFGDKSGLLTALAAEGHRLLAAEMRQAMEDSDGRFLEAGVAYVRFAVSHPAHFDVMFRPELHRRDDPELRAAGAQTRSLLRVNAAPLAVGEGADRAASAALAAWSLVHGLATLHRTGNLPRGADVEGLARSAAGQLFPPGPAW